MFTIVEVLYSKVPNEYSVKSSDLENHLCDFQGIIVGPSLTQKGIDPSLLEIPFYNMSLRGMDLGIRYKMLDKSIERCPNLEYIMVSLSYVDLNHITEYQNASAIVNFEKYFWSSGIKTYIAQNRGATMIKKIYQHYFKNGDSRDGLDKHGYKPNRRPDVKDLHQKAFELTPSIINPHPQFVEKNQEYLSNIIELCLEIDAVLIFISTPIHHSISNNFDDHQSQLTFEPIIELSKEDPNVLYFNFMTNSSFLDEHFQDPIHLNKKGSILLSKLINRQLNQLQSD
jgi:hypothetical protein